MFQDLIREHYEELSPGFRRLADFIMNSTLDAAFLTATELSRRVDVDPATVVRFAQELGYSGYRELSREIKHYVRDQVTATYRKAAEAGTVEALLHALLESAQQNVQQFATTELFGLAEAARILSGAKRIWISGEYMGYDIARFMAKNFEALGMIAQAFSPSMMETASIVSRMAEGDVLLALCNSGPNVDTGYAVHLARAKGLKTVCIGASGVILPAREAELVITVPVKTPAGVPAFGVMTQALSLLFEALANQRPEKTAELFLALQENQGLLLDLRLNTPEYEIASPQESWKEIMPPESATIAVSEEDEDA